MISSIDIKSVINKLLFDKYGYPVIGIEVTEGYEKLSFFTDIRLNSENDETANIVKKEYNFIITYFQAETNDLDNLTKVEEIKDLLSIRDKKNIKRKMKLKVKDRYLSVENYQFGYTGEFNNILQITFEISFYDFCEQEEERQLMKDMKMNTRME